MQCERTDPHDTWHVAVLTADGHVFALPADTDAAANVDADADVNVDAGADGTPNAAAAAAVAATADADVNANAEAAADVWRLPTVLAPRGSRVVPLIVSSLARDYGLDVFCLTGPSGRDDDRTGARMMIAEVCGEPRALPSRARWIAPANLYVNSGGGHGCEHPLGAIIDASARSGHATERPGFWNRLRHWVDTVLAHSTSPHDTNDTPRTVTEAKTQWNAGRGFSLIRLETTSAAVWFKSGGSPNEAEYCIARRVADRHPRHSPRLLACHGAWRGWLTEEVGGPSLRHTSAGIDAWAQAATDIASIQIDERDRAGDWLQSGCADLRVETLASKIEEFFDGMAPIFERQVKASPPPLVRAELAIAADALRRAFQVAARMPDTLVHADLNPDNVFFRDARAVFLDWAGAFVGSPFTAIENLCGHLRRCRAADGVEHEQIEREAQTVREAYASVWRGAPGASGATAALVNDAMDVAPMLRYATLAMRSADWLWQCHTAAATAVRPARDPWLRSLTRSMHELALSHSALSQRALSPVRSRPGR